MGLKPSFECADEKETGLIVEGGVNMRAGTSQNEMGC
jgi:hypothetical protein